MLSHGAGAGPIAVMVSPIAISGVSLERYLRKLHLDDGAGVPDMPGLMSTPLAATQVRLDRRIAFLHSLCGGEWPDDALETPRIPLAFCAQCLDASCGMMWSAELRVAASTVTWRGLGWEEDALARSARSAERSQRGAHPIEQFDTWLAAPFVPAVTLTFDLNQYEEAILAEIDYQTQAEAVIGAERGPSPSIHE
jgi:hypothetical protein